MCNKKKEEEKEKEWKKERKKERKKKMRREEGEKKRIETPRFYLFRLSRWTPDATKPV